MVRCCNCKLWWPCMRSYHAVNLCDLEIDHQTIVICLLCEFVYGRAQIIDAHRNRSISDASDDDEILS